MAIGLRSPEVIPDDVILAFGSNMDGPITLSSAGVAANTALAGVLVGTPVVSASAANSVYIANITASGDIIVAANRGGNSESYLEIDSSAGQLQLNSRGTGSMIFGTAASARVTIDSAGLITIGSTTNATGDIERFRIASGDNSGDMSRIDFYAGATRVGYIRGGRTGAAYRSINFVATDSQTNQPHLVFSTTGDGGEAVRYQINSGGNMGWYGVTPAARASAYTQTFATADKTHAARVGTAVATTAATSTTPFGYTTAAQADAIVQELNDTILDLADTAQLLNAVIDDLQAYGLFQ